MSTKGTLASRLLARTMVDMAQSHPDEAALAIDREIRAAFDAGRASVMRLPEASGRCAKCCEARPTGAGGLCAACLEVRP